MKQLAFNVGVVVIVGLFAAVAVSGAVPSPSNSRDVWDHAKDPRTLTITECKAEASWWAGMMPTPTEGAKAAAYVAAYLAAADGGLCTGGL